jgi:hypothetical protein
MAFMHPCTHKLVTPGVGAAVQDVSYLDIPLPSPAAKQYKFTLDSFQRESVHCLERRENVLVAAHTSAGKTAVAEYAASAHNTLRDSVYETFTCPFICGRDFCAFSTGGSGMPLQWLCATRPACCIHHRSRHYPTKNIANSKKNLATLVS